MKHKRNQFELFEQNLDLFSVGIDGIPIWERIRVDIFREITRKKGQGQAHTHSEDELKNYLQGFGMWVKNIVHRNPYLADEHDFLFVGHQRRKLEQDGYWWDLYCDPVHEQSDLDYVHMEEPHLLSHRKPAKTERLRYLDLIDYGGTIQRKLGLCSPSIPDDVASRLREAEAEVERRFDVEIDIVAEAQKALYVRNTTLPLYERLLDRVDPEVVVLVVSYGKETLIEACKRKNVPVVELQHGIIYDQHFAYSYPEGETKTTFPDYLLTFGEFWNENARFPIPDDRVIPAGYPYLEQRLDRYDDVEPAKQLLFISQGTIGRELSQFALEVHEDDRIDHEVVYKLHPGEYDRWEEEYPWLAASDIRVIDESEPPLYQLFAESSAQVGIGSTAVYEGLCFDLETFVYEGDDAYMLRPLVEDGAAPMIKGLDELAEQLGSSVGGRFDREWFFKSDSVTNILEELERIRDVQAVLNNG